MRTSVPKERVARVVAWRDLTVLFVAVRRAMPGVAVRDKTFVLGTTLFVRGTTVVVRDATVFVLRASVDVVTLRSRVFAVFRDVTDGFVVFEVPRDWLVLAVFCADARDAARATSLISRAPALQNATTPRHTQKSHFSPFIPLYMYASKIIIFGASRKYTK